MTRTRGPLLLTALVALSLVVVARAREGAPEAELRAACEARGHGMLANARLEVRSDGELPRCEDDGLATRLFVTLDRRLGALAPALEPERVLVKLSSTATRIEARPSTQTLLVPRRAASASDDVWLHELAHLRAAGARPRAGAGARLARALDEGFADYFAAAVTGEPIVGSGHAAARDLSRPPELAESEWATLGFSGFDAHRFGHELACVLWRREPTAGALLEDLARCLASAALAHAETPADVLHALGSACPKRSRAAISESLRAWAPAELYLRQPPGTEP